MVPKLKKVAVFLARWVALVLLGLFTLWTFGAVYYNGPFGWKAANFILGLIWLVVSVLLIRKNKRPLLRYPVWMACLAMVLIPWSLISPSNDREWQADWRKTGWVEIEGDKVTFHNYRDFDYTIEGAVAEIWGEKTVRLSRLQGIDYCHVAFGGEYIAHSMMSFDFGEDGRVVLSIETRREIGESYSELGGLYKMFELQYIFGSERDLVRVRTNIRDEPIYLYEMNVGVEAAREIFLESVQAQNDLKENPRWYHVITANCTTSFRAQTPERKRKAFDIRLLLNGKLDELLFERGGLKTGDEDFQTLRRNAYINEKAQKVHDAPDFSELIRKKD